MIVETVGIGQIDAGFTSLLDTVVLVVAPGSGDEIQAMKRGLHDRADLIVVSKHDGDLVDAAERAASALGAGAAVLVTSARTGEGIDALVDRARRAAQEGGR